MESGRYSCHEKDGVTTHEIIRKTHHTVCGVDGCHDHRTDADDRAVCLHSAGKQCSDAAVYAVQLCTLLQ